MKFKIDENLPTEFAEILQEAGYDAMTVHPLVTS
jgi:predicted nuclease of predicted toxin-antitoxin system